MKAPFKRSLGDDKDKSIFFVAFFGGCLGIWLSRYVGDNFVSDTGVSPMDWFSVFLAVGIIAIYVWYVSATKSRSSISLDRASDNAYYLGLLFTLVSLAYSLYKLTTLTPSDDDDVSRAVYIQHLLPDFGVALFSTIAGIVGRIYLQQNRTDPLDAEREARDALGVAVRELRSNVVQIIADISILSEQTKLAHSELSSNVTETLQKSSSQNSEVLRRTANDIGTISGRLQNQSDEILKSTERAAQEFGLLINRIGAQFENLSLNEMPDSLTERFETLSNGISKVSSSMSDASRQQQELSTELIRSLTAVRNAFSDENLDSVINSMNNIDESLTNISGTMEQRDTGIATTLENFQSQFQVLDDTILSVQGVLDRLRGTAQSADEASAEYTSEIRNAAERLRNRNQDN